MQNIKCSVGGRPGPGLRNTVLGFIKSFENAVDVEDYNAIRACSILRS